MRDIVVAVLEPFAAPGGRIDVQGEAIDLPAGPTVTLALMLNELATNAAKYGALSTAAGTVAISWTVRPSGEGLGIDLLWAEQGGPPVVPPQRRGFGSRLLAASAQQIKGEHEMDFAPTGLQCRLRFVVPQSPPDTLWTARAG